MCLNLDHFSSPTGSSLVYPRGCKREMKEHLHLVRSSWDGRNRFMDKPISLIVDPLTRAGMMGEHSPVDALVPSIVAEYTLVKGVSHDSYISSPEVVSVESSTPNGWRNLEWVTDDQIERELKGTEERAKVIIADSDDNVFYFSAYGGDWIKAQG
jgi:carnitine O-acetyltransferase